MSVQLRADDTTILIRRMQAADLEQVQAIDKISFSMPWPDSAYRYDLFENLSSALYFGIVINEHRDRFERGDFLVRNLVGADQTTGSVAVGDVCKKGKPCDSNCGTLNRPART